MDTASSVQTSLAKPLFVGLAIGAGSNVIISVLFSLLLTFLDAMFWDAFNANIQIFFLLSILTKLGLFIILFVVVQKTLKNKFITIGTASGFVGSMILAAILVPQLIK